MEPVTTYYELEILGELPSHKNEKQGVIRTRTRDTAKGSAGSTYAGVMTKPDVKLILQRAAMQIPGELRDLKLRHPEMVVHFTVAREDVDRDNIFSTVLDMLYDYGVIADDNVRHFNGVVKLMPAIVGEEWKTWIQMWVTE